MRQLIVFLRVLEFTVCAMSVGEQIGR